MKFIIEDPQEDQNFSLIYRDEDYAFDIEPFDGTGDASIMINELQLEIDHEGKIIYVWGYCPLIKYQETEKYPQKYQTKSLVAVLDKPPTLGISCRLNENERWPIYINKKKVGYVLAIQKLLENKTLNLPLIVLLLWINKKSLRFGGSPRAYQTWFNRWKDDL